MDTDDVTKCRNCGAETEPVGDVLEFAASDPQETVGHWCPVCGTLQARDWRGERRILTFVPRNAAAPMGVSFTAEEAAGKQVEVSQLLRGKVFSATDDHL